MDVLSAITIFRGGLTFGCSHQGACEAVDLSAVIIEVIFPSHGCAGSFEDTTQRVTHCRPTRASSVDGPSRVRRDELQVNLGVSHGVTIAISVSSRRNL